MWVWYVLRVAYVGRGIYLTSPQLCSCESTLSRFHAHFCRSTWLRNTIGWRFCSHAACICKHVTHNRVCCAKNKKWIEASRAQSGTPKERVNDFPIPTKRVGERGKQNEVVKKTGVDESRYQGEGRGRNILDKKTYDTTARPPVFGSWFCVDVSVYCAMCGLLACVCEPCNISEIFPIGCQGPSQISSSFLSLSHSQIGVKIRINFHVLPQGASHGTCQKHSQPPFLSPYMASLPPYSNPPAINTNSRLLPSYANPAHACVDPEQESRDFHAISPPRDFNAIHSVQPEPAYLPTKVWQLPTWKCSTPEIHQIEKLRFQGILQYKAGLTI